MDTFVTKPTSEEWTKVLNLYDKVFTAKTASMKAAKAKELTELDAWFQNDLPKEIISRDKKHMTHEEMSKLMKWKLSRGKFRPRLQQFVESNSASDVVEASEKAFKALPKVSEAISALTVLKGVGPATASAVLAAGRPDCAAFMADESMLALSIQPLQYTPAAYLSYLQMVNQICKQLKHQDKEFCWTPHKVELCLWTFHLGQKLLVDDVQKCFSTAKPQKRSSDVEKGDSGSKAKKKKVI